MYSVILCGGSGTRLWPVSRQYYPKQFHNLAGPLSLFQDTVQRCGESADADGLVVLTSSDYRFLVAEQLDALGADERTILLEPVPRNTAPAIALAALYLAEIDPAEVMLVAPADHFIADRAAFRTAVRSGIQAAARGRLVTLGIEPTCPATAYGYIKQGVPEDDSGAENCFRVERFVEKPDGDTAGKFLEEGGYFWNSGIFLFTAHTYLDELEKFEPDVMEACSRSWSREDAHFGFRTIGEAYADSPSVSVDYGIMEKTEKAVMVPYRGDWSDIGSWTGLAGTKNRDDSGNTVTGNVRLHNVSRSFIHASDRLVAGIGLQDTIIVETKDAVLVSTKKDDQDVKKMVEELNSMQAPETRHHARVFRPWGSYEDLDKGEGFHVKRLVIEPGASISLQRHFHRSEHWVVVEGEAVVVRDDEEFTLGRNESTYIPRQVVHKLSNHGNNRLVIIEVQTGDYLDESDIERLNDQYGRS